VSDAPSISPDFAGAAWPAAGDAARAGRGFERWAEIAGRDSDPAVAAFARALGESKTGRALLAALFGNSPFLTDIAVRDAAFLRDVLAAGPDTAFDRLLAAAWAELAGAEDQPALVKALRRLKRRAALLIALADIGGLWPGPRICAALSDLAEASLRLAARHLLRRAAGKGDLALPDPQDPEAGSGLIILGMGKLGARELNYSSDIDIVVFFDDAAPAVRGHHDAPRTFNRLVRDLVRLMDQRTADGYVFRTDLRLRPDPASTPLAVSVQAAETYYGSMALTWERAAMIKARPVAGDRDAARAFCRFLDQFVWRRHLDFAAIEDVHKIKRQIHQHRGHDAIRVRGHDVKVGRGGIREIEFFVQTQQMIFGGRTPQLRRPPTVEGLQALANQGFVTEAVARELTAAYWFLRRVEHRLQMIDDQQTHALPDDEAGLDRLGTFLGYDEPQQFREEVRRVFGRVEHHYARLFESSPAPEGPAELVFTGDMDDPATLQRLGAMGFENPESVAATVRGWVHGRPAALRSERARRLLGEVLPTLLEAVARRPNPDFACFRFDEFLKHLPAGVQLFSLFHANRNLLDLVAEILGTSAYLADYLARNPIQLDVVLTPGFFDSLPDAETLGAELEQQLAGAGDYEDVLTILRRWTNDKRFQAGVHILHDPAGSADWGRFLSDVAGVALQALQPRVEAQFAERHGRFPGGGMAVVAMGKLGGGEASIRSDLDLIMIYDVPEGASESDGPKPLSPALYYARLIQRFLSAITAPTRDGALYEVDMRLRPSGKAGPLATGLEAFARYQREDAWTWEHMALTRARVVSGPPALQQRITQLIAEILCRPRDAGALRRDVADMRARIDKEHGTDSPWAVKYMPGGLVDIEFVAQYLQLRHGTETPEALAQNTGEVLRRMKAAGHLAPEAADTLIAAGALWHRIQAWLRLALEGTFDPDAAPPALCQGLARTAFPDEQGPDITAVARRIRDLRDRAHAVYREILDHR
jgi:glutamate-ammonia-ligase adenylyltransferase